MPKLYKKALSVYLRTGCERQFRFLLYQGGERVRKGMPPNQQSRSALGLVGEAGDEWQAEKVAELSGSFGSANVRINPSTSNTSANPDPIQLHGAIATLAAFQYVVEAEFELPQKFRLAFGLHDLVDEFGDGLGANSFRPDILQVLPSIASGKYPDEGAGRIVTADGTLQHLAPNDTRLRLRVIDVKLSSEPGANYFAEVVLYSIALAAWLEENGYADRFVVTANAAVWPGSHSASALAKASQRRNAGNLVTDVELAQALDLDLETAQFDVFVPRIKKLLTKELPHVLSTPWQKLQWHADYRCLGCEFNGMPWKDRDGNLTAHVSHCWPQAEREDHLSRLAGLSRGAARTLSTVAPTIKDVADLDPSSAALGEHQTLKSKPHIWIRRAQALRNNLAGRINESGTSAVMPKWADLKIWMTFDYDPSSAITGVMCMRAVWIGPGSFGTTTPRDRLEWGPIVGLVRQRDVATEGNEFINFLKAIAAVFKETRQKTPDSTYQIYLWDEAQLRHLQRLIGRHLALIVAEPSIRNLAWLVPTETLHPNVNQAARKSPITLVSDAVQAHLALPIAHHYTLLEVVKHYAPEAIDRPPEVHPLYQDPLSNLIPPERLYDYWSDRPAWLKTQDVLRETSEKKTLALKFVADRLAQDLKDTLSNDVAPPISFDDGRLDRATDEFQLLYQFTRLNVALQQLDSAVTYALPAQERIARFKAALLARRLVDPNESKAALEKVNSTCATNLEVVPGLMIYELSPASRDVNFRAGDLGLALSPADDPSFLNRGVRTLGIQTKIADRKLFKRVGEVSLSQVDLLAIDRQNGLVVLRRGVFSEFQALASAGYGFDDNVMLDKVHLDMTVKKIGQTAQAVGLPTQAAESPRIQTALGYPSRTPRSRSSPSGPASEILYTPDSLSPAAISRNTDALYTGLTQRGLGLNDSQQRAWRQSLSRKLTLIWGPPGTGKSKTLVAILLSAIEHSLSAKAPLRVLVTAHTYTAIDNVLKDLTKMLISSQGSSSQPSPPVYRLRSHYSEEEPEGYPINNSVFIDLQVNKDNPDQQTLTLKQQLSAPAFIVVGSNPHQLHNLAFAGERRQSNGPAQQPWFDFVVVDEASQMDVALSTLVWTKVAPGATLVLAGDDKQLPPIQQADPPIGLESQVGSVYSFFRDHHRVEPVSLNINYRSNETLVDFVKLAGYSNDLKSGENNASLRMQFSPPSKIPASWPSQLEWSPGLLELLNPDKPVACFIYEDQLSGQSNEFEAQVVAGLIALLYGNLGKSQNQGGSNRLPQPYTDEEFWQSGAGIVTPHRAQVGRIVDVLARSRAPSASYTGIASAVDSVERFQGQERDVIIASLAVGDPDTIRSEDEFLYSLNRFNVMASRAKSKLIVLASQSIVDHLPNDADVLKESALLKQFVESYCSNRRHLGLHWRQNGQAAIRTGEIRER